MISAWQPKRWVIPIASRLMFIPASPVRAAIISSVDAKVSSELRK
jgi:hypothetical protein